MESCAGKKLALDVTFRAIRYHSLVDSRLTMVEGSLSITFGVGGHAYVGKAYIVTFVAPCLLGDSTF